MFVEFVEWAKHNKLSLFWLPTCLGISYNSPLHKILHYIASHIAVTFRIIPIFNSYSGQPRLNILDVSLDAMCEIDTQPFIWLAQKEMKWWLFI